MFLFWMFSMAKRARLLLFLLALSTTHVLPRSCTAAELRNSKPAIATEDCPLFPWLRGFFDFKCFHFAEELLRCILWLFKSITNIVASIINTVLETCFEIVSNVFSGVRQIIKAVEFVGYCVRLLLRANYNFVSSLLISLQKLLETLMGGLWKLFGGIISVIVTLFQSIIRLLHDIVLSMPRAFELGCIAIKATKEAASSALYSSYIGWKYILTVPGSALLTIITTARAVLECLLMTMFNTIILVTEMTANSIMQALQCMGNLIVALSSTLVSVWESVVHGTRYFVNGIGHFVTTTAQLLLSVMEILVSGFVFLTRAIGQILERFLHCGYLAFEASFHGWKAICQYLSQQLATLVKMTLHYTPGGRWTLGSLMSAYLVMLGYGLAFGVNPVAQIFKTTERLFQSMMRMFSSRPSMAEEAPMHKQRWPGTGSMKTDDTHNLREALDEEIDRHLCVVCKDQAKNMIVMPCRHLCLCTDCSRELLRLRQQQGRLCPLCRGRITRILEVYV